MKRNDIRQLHTKTINELTRMLADTDGELSKLKLEWFSGKLKNHNAMYQVRKNRARLLTILGLRTTALGAKESSSVEETSKESKKEPEIKQKKKGASKK